MSDHPPKPTADDCSNNAVFEWGAHRCMAIWYPQMGGYVGKAVVVGEADGGCFEAYVWHDGQFPFSDDPRYHGGTLPPVKIHHCMAGQFVEFGEAVAKYLSTFPPKELTPIMPPLPREAFANGFKIETKEPTQ